MRSEKQKAVASAEATTQQQDFQIGSYRKPVSASTKFRELAANLLLGLQAETLTAQQCKHGWQLFEVVLRQYYELKTSGGQQL